MTTNTFLLGFIIRCWKKIENLVIESEYTVLGLKYIVCCGPNSFKLDIELAFYWKVFCCKLTRISTIDVSIADLPPTTDTSAHSSQAAMFAINENSKYKGSKTIPTDTNPAYESVMLRRKREEYTMTKNELYGNLN